MRTRFAGLALACASLVACGKDRDAAEVAVEATFEKLRAAMTSGGAALDPSLFDVPPASPEEAENPLAYPTDSSKVRTLGAAADDGSAGLEVTVANKFTPNADGTGTVKTTVTEVGTGFKFLEFTVQSSKPVISLRIPRHGLAAVDPKQRTGTAFVVVEIAVSGTVTRTFENTSTSGKTLINFGSHAAPSGTATGKGAGVNRMLLELKLSRAGDKVVAKLGKQISGYGGRMLFARDGGPTAADQVVTYGKLTVGGLGAAEHDFMIPVGNDFKVAGVTGVAADAPVAVELTTTGGITGGIRMGGLFGPFNPPEAGFFDQASFSFAAPMTGLDATNDGKVQIDRTVSVGVNSMENVPRMKHSIQQDDMMLMDLISSVYLGSFAGSFQEVVLLR